MMNYTSKTFPSISKSIGIIITITFSLIAFVHGQNCNLLPTRSPYTTLADGNSKTGYAIPEATYTQSCYQSLGTISCISGSIANGNIFKYASCIPHTRSNCTTPTVANHLEFKTLYKSTTATYTETCQDLSQNLQCLNGTFTGVPSASLYISATCADPNRAQCVDIRSNSYRDHGEIIIGYAGTSPGIGQTCATQKRTLTCYNGTRSGNGTFEQVGLSTGCTDPGFFTGCVNNRVSPTITVPHNSSLNAYTSPTSIGTGTCTNVLRPLTCINGMRSGNGLAQQAGLYSECTQAGTAPCANIIDGTGMVLHGSFATVFTDALRMQTSNESCSDVDLTVQCVNGTRSGYDSSLHYTGCQNVESGACYNNLSNTYTPHLQSLFVYTGTTPTTSFGCDSVKMAVTCNAGIWHRFTGSGPIIGSSFPGGFYASCGGCILPRGTSLAEGTSTLAYSYTQVEFPKSCGQYATTLSCSGGNIEGNRHTYQHSGCSVTGGLISGIDLTIDKSPTRTNYYPMAQGSSPELNIIFYNHGTTPIDVYDAPAGLLSCSRLSGSDININVYSSKVLTHFSVAPGTKVGVNIRIKSIFTQSLGKKTLVCTINPTIYSGGSTDLPGNNVWTGTFEIVEADRFDLALSKSIQGISNNLEAAEGAKGTQGLQNFLFNKIMNVLVPLVIIIGILSAILGFYKLMFSSDENATKEGTRYIIYGIIGIIVIMSAKFIGQNVYDMLTVSGGIEGSKIATGLYEDILYPFIKLAIYLVLGAMFVILVGRVITFIFGSDADAQKKAGTLIGWNVISMLVIIGAKQIVEAIYGKQEDVVNANVTNLSEIGSGVLADKNIPLLYQVINYALGIASLVILVIIIVQTIKLLMKPDDPAQIKNIKNSLMYMFIGILVLGAGYLIVNFAIIN